MTRFLIAAILFLQAQLPVQQVQPGTITGRLLSPRGVPEPGVRIAAVPAAEAEKTGGTALLGISLTDEEGRYRLENIPPGRYYIFAGLIDLPSYYPNATSIPGATPVDVEAGVTLSGIDFKMARPASLTVAGRLTVPSTMKVGDGSTVTLAPMGRASTGTSQQARIALDGSFEFPRVAPGEYSLTSSVPGSTPVSVRVTDTDLSNIAMPVVDCNTGVVVSGRLIGTPQTPVSIMSLNRSQAGCSSLTRVEPDGTFAFANVPEGTYQLQLSPAPLGWSTIPLTVEKIDLRNLEVKLPSLVVIRGRATVEDGTALPRAARGGHIPIQAVQLNGLGVVTSSIQDDGSFEFKLPQGRYRISVSNLPGAYYLKSIRSGSFDLSMSPLEIGSTSAEDVRVTLGWTRRPETSGVRVTGRVTFAPTGALPRSESVLLVSVSAGKNAAVLESILAPDGAFEFTDVSPGTYNIETYPDTPAALQGIVVNRTDVSGIEFVLPVLVKVRGDIEWVLAEGLSVPAVRPNVSVQFTRNEGSRVLAWGSLAQSDGFHFYLPEGDYRFSVTDIPPDFDLGSVTSGDSNVLEDGLRVRSSANPPNLRVTLRSK